MKIIKLSEMPYIDFKGENFDMQFEEFSNKEDIINFIQNILSGKKVKDKYGDVIELKTWNDKRDFVDSLKNSSMFKNAINNMFTEHEKTLLNIIIQQAFKN